MTSARGRANKGAMSGRSYGKRNYTAEGEIARQAWERLSDKEKAVYGWNFEAYRKQQVK